MLYAANMLGSGATKTRSMRQSIRAVVILAGVTGRLAPIRDLLRRNLFELPRHPGRSLLAAWCERFRATVDDGSDLPILLAIDEKAPEPDVTSVRGVGENVRVTRDSESSRGTAGILRDLSGDYDDDDHIIVVQASDLACEWSIEEADELVTRNADVVLSADRDLRPAGFTRVRCGLLRRVPSVGFVDLKEQFLARCATSADVHVLRSRGRQAGSLHSLSAYLTLVGMGSNPSDGSLATAGTWRADRSIVEPSATVESTAILFDSVVLAGARVGSGAVVVRSLIGRRCDGAAERRDRGPSARQRAGRPSGCSSRLVNR